jgi:hypothetical protein
MNCLSGMACSASWLFIISVRTQGGAISRTLTFRRSLQLR